MRVEPAPYVFRNEDRRNRRPDRRAPTERRNEAEAPPRASPAPRVWFAPAFCAQIFGQVAPETIVLPARAQRAYLEPEARTPLRPSIDATA